MMLMTREEQIAFMEGCQQRLRGYVSNWMRDPFFRGAFHYRRDEELEAARMETARPFLQPKGERLMELTRYEIISLMRHHLGLLDPSPDRMIALSNELKAAIAREREANAAMDRAQRNVPA